MTNAPTSEESRKFVEEAREQDWKLPSFGKELYLGDFRLDLIHPLPVEDPEAEAAGAKFLAEFREFLETKVDPLQIERDAKIPDEVIQGLKDLGAFGIKIPKKYGGLGHSRMTYGRAMSMAGTYHGALGALLSAHQSIGVAEPLVIAGTEEQKQKWLPKVAKDHISAFLLTEPDVGSDPARLQCSAVPTEDGSGYILNGRKLWATNGAIADIVVIMARIPKSEGRRGGVSAFVLDYHSEGVSIEHRNQFMGLRGIENSVTRLENVFVPKENLIGGEGEGLKIAFQTLNTGRLSLPAICAGTTKWASRVVRDFGTERAQWGKPVGQHDEVASKIASIHATAFGIEAVVEVATRLAHTKRSDIRIEAAVAKLVGSELAWKAIDDAVQVRGGRGYETAESLAARGERAVPMERALRDMRINRIFEGSTEIMHLQIAREAIDQHLQIAGELIEGDGGPAEKAKLAAKAGGFYAKWFPQLTVGDGQNPRSYDEFGELATHLRFVERNARKLARVTFYAMGKNGAKLVDRTAILGRIVDIGAELFSISSAVVYAEHLKKQRPQDAAAIEELADAFSQQCRRRAKALFAELKDNDDDQTRKVAKGALEGRYSFIEEGVIAADPETPLFGDPENYRQPEVDVEKTAKLGQGQAVEA
jgi:alkylation response protein AidB-like acyl-CoA dehydrogenase